MKEEEKEELAQSGHDIGYNAADDLLTLFGDLPRKLQYIVIEGFIDGFNSWGIDEIKIVKTGEGTSRLSK
jgi:hypothetical protein